MGNSRLCSVLPQTFLPHPMSYFPFAAAAHLELHPNSKPAGSLSRISWDLCKCHQIGMGILSEGFWSKTDTSSQQQYLKKMQNKNGIQLNQICCCCCCCCFFILRLWTTPWTAPMWMYQPQCKHPISLTCDVLASGKPAISISREAGSRLLCCGSGYVGETSLRAMWRGFRAAPVAALTHGGWHWWTLHVPPAHLLPVKGNGEWSQASWNSRIRSWKAHVLSALSALKLLHKWEILPSGSGWEAAQEGCCPWAWVVKCPSLALVGSCIVTGWAGLSCSHQWCPLHSRLYLGITTCPSTAPQCFFPILSFSCSSNIK